MSTDSATDLEADAAIMAHVRATVRGGRSPHRAGAFLVVFTPSSASRHLNYALPDDAVEPSAADVAALIDVFRSLGRQPRLEFLPSLAPALETALTGVGFRVEERLPLMTCARDAVHDAPPPAGIRLERPADDSALLEMATMQHHVFGEPEPANAASVQRLRTTLDQGGRAVMARTVAGDDVVGAGLCGPVGGGAAEIAGVAVVPLHRRRGLAAAMVAALAREAFDAGAMTVFLEAAAGADGAYRNAGFRTTSMSLHMALGDRGAV